MQEKNFLCIWTLSINAGCQPLIQCPRISHQGVVPSIIHPSCSVVYSFWRDLFPFAHTHCSVVMCKNVIIWCSGAFLQAICKSWIDTNLVWQMQSAEHVVGFWLQEKPCTSVISYVNTFNKPCSNMSLLMMLVVISSGCARLDHILSKFW